MMKNKNWFSDAVTYSANKCPKCHSILITSMGSSKTNVINNHCNKCKYEWNILKNDGKCQIECIDCQYHMYDFGIGEICCGVEYEQAKTSYEL